MRLLITVTLLTIYLAATGQTSPAKKNAYLYTESKYNDSAGKGIVIQNSFPKGGGTYALSSGKTFSYVIFWNRIINETADPIDLAINFPADSFAIFASPDSYLKIFLPPDSMSIDKESMFDYGFTGLKSFLDTGFFKPSQLRRTINPKEECIFYIAVLFYQGTGSTTGSARTELVLKKQDLFYNIGVGSQHAIIPCGKIWVVRDE